jgi:serine/threonine protein kinase
MGSHDPFKRHDSGAITPPATPTSASHSKNNSASSDFLSSLAGHRRGDSTWSPSGRLSLDNSAVPGSTEPLIFPNHLVDYEIRTDEKGRKKPIGVGAWSDVYLATPELLKSIQHTNSAIHNNNPTTPPITPIRSRDSLLNTSLHTTMPPLYAIKVPGSTSAKKVLNAEARILSYLSRFPDAEQHVVPFYGQDARTGSLVLKALAGTLEDWISQNLNALPEPLRSQRLAAIFPSMATSLIDSLIWMQDLNCIHADVKPSNILIPLLSSPLPEPVFSDFSSTLLTILDDTDATPPPLGAGTWDFLDPACISSLNPATPSETTDLWSLGITLLYVVLGRSPYEAFKGNKFQQREMIKSGTPLQCLAYDDVGVENVRILKTLERDLGFDVGKWFGRVLVKKHEKRVGIAEWREELVGGVRRDGERM